MNLKEKKYKKFKIYYFEDFELSLGEKIINKEFKVIKTFKDTKRNYVALISIDDKKYVLKEPRNEFRLLQRKIMTLFKLGEAATTLKNLRHHIEKLDIKEYVTPYVAIIKRRFGMITYSSLLMEYCDGESVGESINVEQDFYKKNKVIELITEIHKKNIYHGDMSAHNFIILDDKLKIMDTQGKKMIMGNYRAHYDMITFQLENFKKMKYPYEKNFWYYFAYYKKNMKKLKIFRWLRIKRKKNRNKRG